MENSKSNNIILGLIFFMYVFGFSLTNEQNNYNHVKTLYRHYFIHIIDTSNRIRLYNGSKTCIFSKSFTTDKHFVSTFIPRKCHYSQKYTMLQICGVAFAAGIVSMILFSNECMLPCNHKDDIG